MCCSFFSGQFFDCLIFNGCSGASSVELGAYKGDCMKKEDFFTRFTSSIAAAMGHAWVFAIALLALIIWALSGPLLGFSDTWQLIINTSTTIVTFLMVFIIQNTQNRDNLAINLKLDVMMKKMGLNEEDLLEAEEKSDKYLKAEVEKEQNGSKKSTSKRRA
jgi:low affinity Fe/Cu permease